jgi:hypothetical protein
MQHIKRLISAINLQCVAFCLHMHETQLHLLCSHLQQARQSLSALSFETLLQSTTLPAPTNGRVRLKVPQNKEDTMRNFTSMIISVVLAAGISGIFFTATLV